MKNVALLLLLCLSALRPALATEGMWLPQLLSTLNEKEMKSMGLKLSAKDIYNVNGSSLKDAIVSFGGFCTGEVISQEGLLLTNHHCGYRAIQSHSSVGNNYLAHGFWAMQRAEELPNEGLFATFIIRIDDVTEAVLAGVGAAMSEAQRQSAIDKNIQQMQGKVAKEAWQEYFVRAFFEGNKYYLFVTETYRDVRLVGAPPSDIGKFGADTDNWMWPRHTGDFALFRIYAGPDNKPAAYSPNNKPYQPRRSLSINTRGLKEGDFTMVFGFPGRTQQYLPAAALTQTIQYTNPEKIHVRNLALQTTDGFMRSHEAIKIQYASKYASTANAWKKWIGEVQGLEQSQAVRKRTQYEQAFQQRVEANPAWKDTYGYLLPSLNRLYASINPLARERDIFNETLLQTELLRQAAAVGRTLQAIQRSEATAPAEVAKLKAAMDAFYKDYSPEVDLAVAQKLWVNYMQKLPATLQPAAFGTLDAAGIEALATQVYAASTLARQAAMEAALRLPPADLVRTLLQDPALLLVQDMQGIFARERQGKLNSLQDEINQLQRLYMQAQMVVMPEKRFYPDANSTLRITYGKVEGAEPRDGIVYKAYTYLDGVLEKYKPGDYEFNVPEKLLTLHQNRDYGRYGVNGRMPVCFIGSNHTTGGNSGSPALDANGHLVGLNFDRAWEGTMSDLNYDATICRNIMVDIRYILFIIDKFAGAGHLVQEMRLL